MLDTDVIENKICFFLPNLGDGGLTRITLLLISNLIDRKIDIDLVMSSKIQPKHLLKLIPDGVNIVRLESHRAITSLIPLIKYLEKDKPNFLISGGTELNVISILAKKLSRSEVKVIVTEHSMPSSDIYSTGKFKGKSLEVLTKNLYPKADHIVAVSNSVAKDLSSFINYPQSLIKVIYNPVVSSNLIKQSHEKVDHFWLVEKSCPVIVYVGRLVSMKNIPLIIKAFSILNKSINCKLLIIGDGPEKQSILNIINRSNLQDKIDVIGYRINPYKYMRLADALVLASEWEGLPTVLIESMAFNTPVIATNNLEGAKEIFDNNKFGILVNMDEKSLATALINVLNKTISFDNLIERSEDFSTEASINNYIELMFG